MYNPIVHVDRVQCCGTLSANGVEMSILSCSFAGNIIADMDVMLVLVDGQL
jgi:hypothetical protein